MELDSNINEKNKLRCKVTFLGEKGTRLLFYFYALRKYSQQFWTSAPADYSELGIITLPLREGKIFCKKILGGVKKEKGVGLFLFLDLHRYKF